MQKNKSKMPDQDQERIKVNIWSELSDLGYNVGTFEQFCLKINETFETEEVKK